MPNKSLEPIELSDKKLKELGEEGFNPIVIKSMIQSERERHAQDAINEFVQYSCACILPGTEGHVASEVGSGVIICTRNRHYVVLTAKHIAENAKREEYRLGFFRCSNPIPKFVAAIMPFPNDVDVALLIVKDDLALPLKQISHYSGNNPYQRSIYTRAGSSRIKWLPCPKVLLQQRKK